MRNGWVWLTQDNDGIERVRLGVWYNLYIRGREKYFNNYVQPEVLKTSLEEVILKAKILQVGMVSPFLEKFMNPRETKCIIVAFKECSVVFYTIRSCIIIKYKCIDWFFFHHFLQYFLLNNLWCYFIEYDFAIFTYYFVSCKLFFFSGLLLILYLQKNILLSIKSKFIKIFLVNILYWYDCIVNDFTKYRN